LRRGCKGAKKEPKNLLPTQSTFWKNEQGTNGPANQRDQQHTFQATFTAFDNKTDFEPNLLRNLCHHLFAFKENRVQLL